MTDYSATEYLRVTGLHAFYGESHILHGMDFIVNRGELVALLGRNGAGRTTTLKAVLGLVDKRTGSVMVNGREVIDRPAYRIARLGVGYCPEERGIFSSLSAQENLLLPPMLSSQAMGLEQIYGIFPELKARRRSQGSRLSGGEQQMLAIARILRSGARLLLLDEVSEGLAPVIVQRLKRVVAQLKGQGFTMVLAEQNFRFAASLADRMYVVERGRIVMELNKAEMFQKQDVLEELLGV
jgi:branched-chain amino acid transport system ATP-binding protein